MTKGEIRTWLRVAFAPQSIFHNAIGAFLATLVALFVAMYGQGIESAISPVIYVAPYTDKDSYRDPQTACFTMHLTKLHSATVVKYEFFAETLLSSFIPLSPYLADPKTHQRLADSDLVSHTAGASWARTYCFDMPSTINDSQCFRITGHAEHARHPFWITISPVRPLIVKALVHPENCPL